MGFFAVYDFTYALYSLNYIAINMFKKCICYKYHTGSSILCFILGAAIPEGRGTDGCPQVGQSLGAASLGTETM